METLEKIGLFVVGSCMAFIILSCPMIMYHVCKYLIHWVYLRVVYTDIMYNKRVKKDWWSAYRKRERLREPSSYLNTVSESIYDIDGKGPGDMSNRDGWERMQFREISIEIYNALVSSEISLKTAHYCNGGFLGNYTTAFAHCLCCLIKLPITACYINGYYYCLSCIKKSMLPRFCAPRILLMREMKILPIDIVKIITRFIIGLSFSQTSLKVEKCQNCFVYRCDTPGNLDSVKRLVNEITELPIN